MRKTPPQEIALITGGTIAGTVTTAAGAPVKGSVHLEGPSMNFGTETQATGAFSFKHLRPGTYRVSADTSEGSASQVIALGQDEVRTGIVLVMEAGRSIRGMVRGLQATALDNVRIMLRPESKPGSFSAQPDQHGAYALNGVPAGRAVMTVFGPTLHFDRTVDVPADQDVALDIVFPSGARLSGRVTKGGKPVAGRNVWMRPVEDKSDTLYRATTQADGRMRSKDCLRATTACGQTRTSVDSSPWRATRC